MTVAKKKAPTVLEKLQAAAAAGMKSTLAELVAEHVPFSPGDKVSLTYIPSKGDALGTAYDLGGYWGYNHATGSYPVMSYDAKTHTYQVQDYDGDTYKVPFYCLKLKKKSDGRDVTAGNYSGRINDKGTSVALGCQTVSLTEVENIYNAMKKVKAAYKPKPKVVKTTTATKKKARR